MSQLSWSDLVDGQVPVASDFNTPLNAIKNRINNGVEADNIASGAVGTTALASDAVTTAKLAHPVLFEKGSDIASATTTDLSTATGNVVDITGTTTITGFGTLQSGSVMFLRFTGALLLTHNATSLILPTGANITTAAGDEAIMVSLGSGNWRCANFQRKDGSALLSNQSGNSVQVVNYQTGAMSSGTTDIPADDTIPQNTEGDEYMTLSITPTSATNKLKIEVVGNFDLGGGDAFVVALFQDSTANALAAVCAPGDNIGAVMMPVNFTHYMTAGTTSATTFKVRAGSNSGAGGTLTFNGNTGARLLGGVAASSITITEIKV